MKLIESNDSLIDLKDNLYTDQVGFDFYYKNNEKDKLVKLPVKYFVEITIQDYYDLEGKNSYALSDLSDNDKEQIAEELKTSSESKFIVFSDDYWEANRRFKNNLYDEDEE